MVQLSELGLDGKTSLSAIYQGHVPYQFYSTDNGTRTNYHACTYGTVCPHMGNDTVDRQINHVSVPYLSYPLQKEDPEPYSTRYSAGGIELVDNNLEQNLTK